MENVIIETGRLQLKGFTTEDIQYIFENLPKPEIMSILGHRSEEEYLIEESKYKSGYAAYNRRFLVFLLIDKETNNIIGRCGLHNWNKEQHRAEIGYTMMDEDSKRKGFMSEAVQAIIAYGFDTLKLHRIEAIVGTSNEPSLRIIKKNKLVQEGLLREHYFDAGKFSDSVLFSKLYDEYLLERSDT